MWWAEQRHTAHSVASNQNIWFQTTGLLFPPHTAYAFISIEQQNSDFKTKLLSVAPSNVSYLVEWLVVMLLNIRSLK